MSEVLKMVAMGFVCLLGWRMTVHGHAWLALAMVVIAAALIYP